MDALNDERSSKIQKPNMRNICFALNSYFHGKLWSKMVNYYDFLTRLSENSLKTPFESKS